MEVLEIPIGRTAGALAGDVDAALPGRHLRARVGRLAHVPAAEAGRIDGDAMSRPAASTVFRNTPSAEGERQMLPVQTKSTLMVLSATLAIPRTHM